MRSGALRKLFASDTIYTDEIQTSCYYALSTTLHTS